MGRPGQNMTAHGLLTSVTDSDGVAGTTGYDSRNRSSSFVWQGGGISPASVA